MQLPDSFRWSLLSFSPRHGALYIFAMLMLVALCLCEMNIDEILGTCEPYVEVTDTSCPVASLYTTDSLFINTATATQLERFGFPDYTAEQIFKAREHGYVFYDERSLADGFYVDTMWFNAVKHRIVYDNIARHRYDYDGERQTVKHNNNKKVPHADRQIYIFTTSRSQFIEYGVDSRIIDSIDAYKSRYFIDGMLPIGDLLSATPATIGQVLRPVLKNQKSKRDTPTAVAQVDINTATREQLLGVKGIADKRAEQILEVRDQLGAFVSVEQLADILHLSEDELDNIARQVTCSQGKVRMINVNTLTDKQLSQHPYINRNMAGQIVAARRTNTISSFEELQNIVGDGLTSPFLQYYLSFE